MTLLWLPQYLGLVGAALLGWLLSLKSAPFPGSRRRVERAVGPCPLTTRRITRRARAASSAASRGRGRNRKADGHG